MLFYLLSGISLIVVFVGTSHADLNNGLVAYYPFNGNSNDESGNGFDAVVHGTSVILTEDRFGNPNSAYEITGNTGAYGNGNYIEIPDVNHVFDKITISMWVNNYNITYYHGEAYIEFGEYFWIYDDDLWDGKLKFIVVGSNFEINLHSG